MSNMPVSDTPMQCLRVSNGGIWRLPLQESMHLYLLFYFTAVLAAFVTDSHFDVEICGDDVACMFCRPLCSVPKP
jgi:hypothetical protein